MERQNHGFLEEEYIRSKYLVDKYGDDRYTSEWDGKIRFSDIDFSQNPDLHELFSYVGSPLDGELLYRDGQERVTQETFIPVSIKTKKINCAVEMGSLLRNSRKTDDFILSIGFWEGHPSNIIQRNFLYISLSEWKSHFPKEICEKMNNIFIDHQITNDYADDSRWKKISSAYRKEWNRLGTGINVHFKRDHKNQRRVQCSIKHSYLKDLIAYSSVSIKKR